MLHADILDAFIVQDTSKPDVSADIEYLIDSQLNSMLLRTPKDSMHYIVSIETTGHLYRVIRLATPMNTQSCEFLPCSVPTNSTKSYIAMSRPTSCFM